MKRLCAGAITLIWSTLAARARAENDGVYGRFDGDLDVSPVVGAQIAQGGTGALLGARALFLGSVGPYALLSETRAEGTPAPRTLAVGVAFRPFFIPRWGLDLEHGPAWLDLAIDATTFELGALWVSDNARHFSETAGFETALGIEFPLLGQAAGPWIGVRGALRWRGNELASDRAARLGGALGLTLSWHFLLETHLVDYGDTVSR